MTGIKLQNQSSAVTFSKLNRATLHTAAYLLNWPGCFLCTKENLEKTGEQMQHI